MKQRGNRNILKFIPVTIAIACSILLIVGLLNFLSDKSALRNNGLATTDRPNALPNESITQPENGNDSIPSYVYEVFHYIQLYQKPPIGYVGGRSFQNRERLLPLHTNSRIKILYKEWDVHPKIQGKNRGAERLITGSDSSAYYTKDHYQSFISLR